MLDVLTFIFSSPWIWLGTMLLICVSGIAIARIILAFYGVAATFE